MNVPIFIICLINISAHVNGLGILERTDLTITPCETGRSVAQTVNRIIDGKKIFQEDHESTFRSSIALTHFGEHPDTFKDPIYSGIWQITQTQLDKTKLLNQTLESRINSEFGITWQGMKLEDMLKPLYCGIAARILIQMAKDENGDKSGWLTVSKQSLRLPTIFSRSLTQIENETSLHFENSINQYYQEYPPRGLYDLLIILDGSGSVSVVDFQQALEAIAQVFVANKLASDKIRFGFIEYSNASQVMFDFLNNYSEEDLENAVRATPRSGQGTNTSEAIIEGTQMFRNVQEEYRPKVCILLTDGGSDNFTATIAAADEARANGIIMIAVGIGSGINTAELLGIAGDPTYVILSNNYEDLNELHLWIDVANIPKIAGLGVVYKDLLVKAEQAYYKYEMPFYGLTVETSGSNGFTDHYYCFTFNNPSEALYDQKINKNLFFIQPDQVNESKEVFISAEGIQSANNYTLIAYDGYCFFFADDLVCQECGFKNEYTYTLKAEAASSQAEEGEVLWLHSVHGYGNLLNEEINNDMYVNKGINGEGHYFISAKRRFSQYVTETNLWTMNVTASFNCPGNYISEYTIVIDLV